MPPFTLSAEDKASLSEAELAAFEDIDPGAIFDGKPEVIADDDDGDEPEKGVAEPDDIEEETPEPEKLVDPDKPVGADQDEDAPASTEKEPAAEADPTIPDIALADVPFPDPYVPSFTAEDAAALKAAQDEIKGINTDYSNGELSDEEWTQKLEAADAKRVDLIAKQKIDAAEATKADAKAEEVWNTAAATWIANQGIDTTKVDPKMWDAFDNVVKSITGSELGEGLTMKGQLDAARELFEKKHPGVLPPFNPGRAAKADPKKPAKAEKAAKAEADTVETMIPPNLTGLGSADRSGIDEGRFALIDRAGKTDPIAQEKMLASMSDADFDAWQRTA